MTRAIETRVEACSLDNVAVTPVSQTLVALGIVLDGRAKVFSFQNVGINNIYVSVGAIATAADYVLLPTAGTSLRMTSANRANQLQFIAPDGNTDMNVQQMGDE